MEQNPENNVDQSSDYLRSISNFEPLRCIASPSSDYSDSNSKTLNLKTIKPIKSFLFKS
jgi:hypothetical protein